MPNLAGMLLYPLSVRDWFVSWVPLPAGLGCRHKGQRLTFRLEKPLTINTYIKQRLYCTDRKFVEFVSKLERHHVLSAGAGKCCANC